MIKKFRKMTTLALVLALILTVSASVFAVNTWSHRWFASDGTAVEYYATINTERTYGYIISDSNQGEVNADAYYYYCYAESDTREMDVLSSSDLSYAYVHTNAPTGSELDAVDYYFWAYVPTDNGDEYFESGEVLLAP